MLDRLKKHLFKILRWSERYTKTDMVYLVSQSSWLFIGQGVIFVSSFLLIWVFANYVDPSDYGLYKYVLSVAIIASLTTLTGLGTALARAVSQNHEVSLPRLLKLRMTFGLLGSVSLLGLALYYLSVDNPLLAAMFAVTSVWIPFYETLSDYQFLLQGKKDFKTQSQLKILQRLVLSTLVIISILLSDNLILITFVFFLASTVSQYIAVKLTLKKYPLGNDTDTPYDEIIKFGKRLSVQNIFLIGVAQLDKVLLFKILGPTQLAIYYFAIAIPQELSGLIGNVNSVAFPKLVDKHSPEFKRALLKKVALLTFALALPAILYIMLAPYIFKWLFPVYLEAVFISQLFVGTILFIPASMIWNYFYATAHKSALWFGTFVGPSILVIGIIVLAPLFGLIGAVIATYIRAIVDLISGLYFFLSKTKKP